MPMLYGLVVVGPDCGNVGPLLKEWGYPVFNVDNPQNIGSIIKHGIQMGKEGFGKHNREAQLKEYATAHISDNLYLIYQTLLSS